MGGGRMGRVLSHKEEIAPAGGPGKTDGPKTTRFVGSSEIIQLVEFIHIAEFCAVGGRGCHIGAGFG